MENYSKFDPEDPELLKRHPLITICAKRNSGKTVLLKDFLNKWNKAGTFNKVYLISETYGVQKGAYDCFEPSNCFNEINDVILSKIYEEQKIKFEQDNTHRILIVLDDVISDVQKIRHLKYLNKIPVQGRHCGISCIALSQYYKSFSKIFRANSDVSICFFLNDQKDRESFVQENLSSDSIKTGTIIFNDITNTEYQALIIRKYVTSNDPKIYCHHYIAEIDIPDFKMFNKEPEKQNKSKGDERFITGPKNRRHSLK